MYKKLIAIILATAVALTLCSCAAATARKHLNKAKELDSKGYKLQANTEYIRAMKGIGDRKSRGEVAKTIAINFRKARKFDEAIKYYKISIENLNKVKAKAPYVELAELYLAQGDKGVGAASALMEDIERTTPPGALEMQIKISRMLGDHMLAKNNWGQAKHFYEQKFAKYAKRSKDESYIEEAKHKLQTIETYRKQAPINLKKKY